MLEVVDRLDFARGELIWAAAHLKDYRFPAELDLDDAELGDEILKLALELSLIADLLTAIEERPSGLRRKN